jgi:mRNA-degrading endonuclease RelE of RelBE toxin-antitoxin system
MLTKTKSNDSRVKLREQQSTIRTGQTGGENMPLDYPHLYQIQAGDWRISYAVEHNRLAILVLEVLTADGVPVKDEKMTQKMKIKLLDLPSEGKDLNPEDVGKKLKIKLLDLTAEDAGPETPSKKDEARLKVKLGEAGKSKSGEAKDAEEITPEELAKKSRVTPLDSPTR